MHAALGLLYRALGREAESAGAMEDARAVIASLAATIADGALHEAFVRAAGAPAGS